MISGSSVLNALVLFSVTLLAVGWLSRFDGFMKKGGGLISLTVVGIVTLRMFLPFELPFTYAYRSWNFLAEVVMFFRTYPEVFVLWMTTWIIGAVRFLGDEITEMFNTYEFMSSVVPEEDDELIQEIARSLKIKCPVIVSENVEGPCVSGIFRHKIYFPVLNLSEEDVKLALFHELQHIRGLDSLIKLLFRILSVIFWWNPPVRKFRGKLDPMLEMRCDKRVMRGMNIRERFRYAEMLNRVARAITDKKRAAAMAASGCLVSDESTTIEQRIELIIAKPSVKRKVCGGLAICTVLALFCASFLLVFQPAGAPSAEEFQNDSRTDYHENFDGLEIEHEVNGAFIFKESDGRYALFINYKFSRYLTSDEVNTNEYQDLYIFKEGKQE